MLSSLYLTKFSLLQALPEEDKLNNNNHMSLDI